MAHHSAVIVGWSELVRDALAFPDTAYVTLATVTMTDEREVEHNIARAQLDDAAPEVRQRYLDALATEQQGDRGDEGEPPGDGVGLSALLASAEASASATIDQRQVLLGALCWLAQLARNNAGLASCHFRMSGYAPKGARSYWRRRIEVRPVGATEPRDPFDPLCDDAAERPISLPPSLRPPYSLYGGDTEARARPEDGQLDSGHLTMVVLGDEVQRFLRQAIDHTGRLLALSAGQVQLMSGSVAQANARAARLTEALLEVRARTEADTEVRQRTARRDEMTAALARDALGQLGTIGSLLLAQASGDQGAAAVLAQMPPSLVSLAQRIQRVPGLMDTLTDPGFAAMLDNPQVASDLTQQLRAAAEAFRAEFPPSDPQ